MIVVDTNVLPEEMKAVPAAPVHAWFIRQNSADLFTTTVCEAEILLGVAILPDGKRKRDLQDAARRIFSLFAGRILAFDSVAASAYAAIVSERRRMRRPINDLDAQIAAITHSHGMGLATRNGPDFEGIGLSIVDPWVGSSGH